METGTANCGIWEVVRNVERIKDEKIEVGEKGIMLRCTYSVLTLLLYLALSHDNRMRSS